MITAELRDGQLTIIDRLRETVRLAEGLRTNGELSVAARARALACLLSFGECLRNMHADNVRVVGTSALRRAHDSKTFLAEAEHAIGHPIEVISGIEEARLIYSGVIHSRPETARKCVVLDIGGGSTELILGEGPTARALESLQMGCVAMTEKFFADGKISRDAFDNARIAARLILEPVKDGYRLAEDVDAIGASGTIRASAAVARELGLTQTAELSRAAVDALIERILRFPCVADIALPGLSDSRAMVWPGGLAILAELFSVLHIDRLCIADGALREGLLHSMRVSACQIRG